MCTPIGFPLLYAQLVHNIAHNFKKKVDGALENAIMAGRFKDGTDVALLSGTQQTGQEYSHGCPEKP